MKYTDEYLKQECENKDLKFIGTHYVIKDKKRKCFDFVCNKHKDKGIQTRPVEKINNKKVCQYCNHSLLRINFKEELANINPNIEVFDEYIDSETPLRCKCKIHDYEWMGQPRVLLNGSGCKICASIKRWDARGRLTTDDFKKRIEIINPDIEVIGEYKGSHEHIKCRCKIHGTEWESIACNIQNKTASCPTCALINQTTTQMLSQDEFINRLHLVAPHINPILPYKGLHSTMIFRCNDHNIEFISTPRNFLYKNGRGCPFCSQSSGEKKLIRLLKEKGRNISLQHVFDDCKYINVLRFDAYDIDNNIAYEYQGQQHYYPVDFSNNKDEAEIEFKNIQIRDKIKEDYCNNNQIRLIKIPYWDCDDMEKYII